MRLEGIDPEGPRTWPERTSVAFTPVFFRVENA